MNEENPEEKPQEEKEEFSDSDVIGAEEAPAEETDPGNPKKILDELERESEGTSVSAEQTAVPPETVEAASHGVSPESQESSAEIVSEEAPQEQPPEETPADAQPEPELVAESEESGSVEPAEELSPPVQEDIPSGRPEAGAPSSDVNKLVSDAMRRLDDVIEKFKNQSIQKPDSE